MHDTEEHNTEIDIQSCLKIPFEIVSSPLNPLTQMNKEERWMQKGSFLQELIRSAVVFTLSLPFQIALTSWLLAKIPDPKQESIQFTSSQSDLCATNLTEGHNMMAVLLGIAWMQYAVPAVLYIYGSILSGFTKSSKPIEIDIETNQPRHPQKVVRWGHEDLARQLLVVSLLMPITSSLIFSASNFGCAAIAEKQLDANLYIGIGIAFLSLATFLSANLLFRNRIKSDEEYSPKPWIPNPLSLCSALNPFRLCCNARKGNSLNFKSDRGYGSFELDVRF